MSTLPDGVRRVFRLATRRQHVDQRIDDDIATEVAHHLEMRTQERIARGDDPETARADAIRRFGDPHKWSTAMHALDRQRAAGARRTEWRDDLAQDVRFALRSFARAPLFTALAVLTLALGIGANAAVFGVVKSVLLDALPYGDPGTLMRVYGRRSDGTHERAPMSAGTILDLRARNRSFVSMSAFLGVPDNAVHQTDGTPQLVPLGRVEHTYFQTLRVNAARGRLFDETDIVSDTAFTTIITDAAWQRYFGRQADVIGRPISLRGITRTVVGVLPAGFIDPAIHVEFYLPLKLQALMRNPIDGRMRQNYGVVARMKPGVAIDAANHEVAVIASALAIEHPASNGPLGVAGVPIREALVGDTRTPLLVLMASAGLVLLITCANLAGALLSRTLTRRKEFAVRAALGAGQGRLVRQLLTESVLLASAGAIVGVVLAYAGLALLRSLASHVLPDYATLSLDTGALVVTAVVALSAGIAFGLAPAISVGRASPGTAMRDETRGASESMRSRRLRGLLVAGQIALCTSLLAATGLLLRSFWAMTSAPLGFSPDGVLTAALHVAPQRYPTATARAAFLARLDERLRAIPGVTSAATGSDVPTRISSHNGFEIVGAPPFPSDAKPLALYQDVSADYFRTVGIPIVRGRTFGADERLDAPRSIVITQGMARRYWPGGDAVGARLTLGPGPNAEVFTVVGIVGDVRNDPALAVPQPVLYLANRQAPFNDPFILLRTSGDPASLIAPLRAAIAEIDPTLPLHDITTLRDVVEEGFAGRRLPMVLMTAFGALALLLASVGVYAMFAAMAAARDREFAVRVALGSSRGAIVRLVLRQGGAWMLLGLAVGVAGIAVMTRIVRTMLYGVGPFDPVAMGVAFAVLLVCALVALLVPVRRASRTDPITVLR